MGRNSYPLLTSTLKRVLKNRGITYRRLAARLKISESGLKKILTATDGSLSRIEQISNEVGLSLKDLVQSAFENEPIRAIRFSPNQEEFFLENLDYFHFFWKLVYEEVPVERIKSDFELDERQIFKYLKKLDEFDLVALHPNGSVTIPDRGNVKWVGSGPLLMHIKTNWARALIDTTIAKHEIDKDHHYSLRFYQLTESSYRDLLKVVEIANEEFAGRSRREGLTNPSSALKTVSMVTAIAPRSYVSKL